VTGITLGTYVSHIFAPEHLGLWALGVEVAPLSIVAFTVTWVTHTVLKMCAFVPSVDLMVR
jgi:hypothetical protein